MSSDYQTVTVEQDDTICVVRVARPKAMNAVSVTVLVELADAIETAASESQTIVLTGEGEDAFIGGGDIKEFQNQSGVWFRSEFREAMSDLEDAIEGSRVPVIAGVNGVALGGGTEIALMCDLILATESATFGLPEIGLGIIPGGGGTQRLAHLVGYLKAKELILTGKHISATEAEDIGLVNETIDDDDFQDRVDELAVELADGPPVAQWFAKKSVNETRAQLESGLELEAALAGLAFETDDKEEGMSAFVEKREAEFGDWD
ncbi:enoyl-CoA hydratase/isomerase family protein [Natronorubrum sp. FCH18a]|uniref:enoyl-CoA hydratase/isomerase family protein n=1 Tax=Natronorubrum sp. FCH18a TaxID=3447018 RepID=UPI003F50D59F